MTTETITLGSTPVQVTTGSNYGFVQSRGGPFRWVDADSTPTASQSSNTDTQLTINPPFVIWIWSLTGDIDVNVTTRAAS